MRDLLLIQIDGHRYGVWKNDIAEVKELQNLHRIPLSPQCVAGIAVIADRTVTVADLSVCIGHSAAAGMQENRRILILSGIEEAAGFLVTGTVDSVAVGDQSVRSVPDYLKTNLISSCAVLDSDLFPIIDVSMLYQQFLKGGSDSALPSFAFPSEIKDLTVSSAVRLFRLGPLAFAGSSAILNSQPESAGRIAGLSGLPRYIKGMAISNHGIIPVIDLARRVLHQAVGPESRMLVGQLRESAFGFLVDQDQGYLDFADATLHDLPPIVRLPWLSHALMSGGDIIPFIDIEKLLVPESNGARNATLADRYSPSSEFPCSFRHSDVPVLEFSLLGARHALPKCEVEDVVSFKNFRAIPRTPEIVVGVAELDGALLPVIDLAIVFGRRSLTAPDWSMVVVKNGDFRALVITEAVFGERLLPVGSQRELPILVPNNVVYGCYPDANGVRLILNVEAMAVHFEKSLVREMLPSLSQEMKQAPASIVPSLINQEAAASEVQIPEQEQASIEVATMSSIPIEQKREEADRSSTAAEVVEKSRVEEATAATIPHQEVREEHVSLFANGQQPAHTDIPAESDEEPKKRTEAEIQDPVLVHVGAAVSKIQTKEVKQSARKDISQEVNERLEKVASVHASQQGRRQFEASEPQPANADYASDKQDKRLRNTAAMTVAALMAGLVMYFFASSKAPESVKTVNEIPIVKVEPVRSEPKAKIEVPLVLEIPAERPITIDVYTVVNDDTLWSISKRFTGNPYNYPRIAGENRIADPDMIFPGQKIRLQRAH